MKPSETGVFRLKPYTYMYSTSGNGWWDTVYLQQSVKSRNPTGYSKKEYVTIGVGQQLLNRSYWALVHDCIWPAIQVSEDNGSYKTVSVDLRTTHQYLTPPSWYTLLEANAENQLIVEFLNKIQERKLSLIEETRNFRESIKTIATSAERLALYAKQMFRNPKRWLTKAYKKRDLRGGRAQAHRTIKTYGDLWLEGRYHWLPTYMTMRDAFIGLQDMVPGLPVSKKGPGYSGEYSLHEAHGWYPNSEVRWDVEASYSHKMICFITAQSEAAMLARRYGAGGIADLAAVAWELTPWTLVVDWIVPVSDVLLAHNALSGLTAHNPCQVRKTTRLGFCDATPGIKNTTRRTAKTLQNGEIWYESYDRTTSSISSLEPNLFIAKEIINPLRIIDSLSFFSGGKFGKKVISGSI